LAAFGRFFMSGMNHPRPDVVQGFQLNGITAAAAALARHYRAPLIIKIAGRDNLERCASRTGRVKLRGLSLASAAMVAPSLACRALAARMGVNESRLHYIPNGVDVNHFQPASSAERNAARQSLGVA